MKFLEKGLVVLATSALLLSGCAPAVTPEPDMQLPPQVTTPTVPTQPTDPSHPTDPTVNQEGDQNIQLLSAAKMSEIEAAWYQSTSTPIGSWCEEDDSFIDGVRYYGSYAGFDILFRPTGDDAITQLEIGDMTFKHNNSFDIYAYRDGNFLPLKEAYAGGALTHAELQELSMRHLIFESRLKKPTIPSISLDVQLEMKQAFLRQFVDKEGYSVADLSVIYYGEYGGAHVGFINGIFMYTQALCSETVGGVTFRYNTGQKLLVYYEGELMRLGEAYDRGILTKEHLIALHNAYAPKDDSFATE